MDDLQKRINKIYNQLDGFKSADEVANSLNANTNYSEKVFCKNCEHHDSISFYFPCQKRRSPIRLGYEINEYSGKETSKYLLTWRSKYNDNGDCFFYEKAQYIIKKK